MAPTKETHERVDSSFSSFAMYLLDPLHKNDQVRAFLAAHITGEGLNRVFALGSAYVGQTSYENKPLDVYIAPGCPTEYLAKKNGKSQNLTPVQLFLRRYPDKGYKAESSRWRNRPTDGTVALPRTAQSASPIRQADMNGNIKAFFSSHAVHAEPPNENGEFDIWTQLAWTPDGGLSRDLDSIKRGNPESPDVSYFHYQRAKRVIRNGVPHEAALYSAIVCSAITDEGNGHWRSWQEGDQIDLHLPSTDRPNRLPPISADLPSTLEPSVQPLLGPPSRIPPSFNTYRSLSHRQKLLYGQDYAGRIL